MDISAILSHVDHTLLSRTATSADILQVCMDGIRYQTASVCIPPCFVREAKSFLMGQHSDLAVCTVIGFPNGYATTAAKVAEAQDAIACGADELDVVINVGWVKAGRYDLVSAELSALRQATKGHILKVIVETCLLTQEEKIEMCRIVTDTHCDYIKTSTGFSTGGATKEDIALFARYIGPDVKMKAAGGIRTLEDAQAFLDLGCNRLGTSAIVGIAKQQ